MEPVTNYSNTIFVTGTTEVLDWYDLPENEK